MSIKRKISAALLLSSLAVSALPAAAAPVTLDFIWNINRYNTGGTTTKVLPPHANHFCYLSRVGVRETDTSTESAICNVKRSGTVWLLQATLGRSSDNDVFCSVHCYRF